MQVVEIVLSLASEAGNSISLNMSSMRLLRILRIVRLMSELRRIVVSIIESARPFLCTMLLLFLMIYLVGIILTQSVVDYKMASDEHSLSVGHQNLDRYFG